MFIAGMFRTNSMEGDKRAGRVALHKNFIAFQKG
jgi:hypothetical protein